MSRWRRIALLWFAFIALPALAAAPPPVSMVRFDQLYIPALALTTAAQGDARAAPRALAATQRLAQRWPALRQALQQQWPGADGAAWTRALDAVDRQLALAGQAVQRAEWKAAHEALEEVRLVMMAARRAAGIDYFVDRLTAFHEPMEVLALAGSQESAATLTPTRRGELERAFAEARALWRGIEQNPPDAAAHGLSAARQRQLGQGLADETAALERLSQALRESDNAAVLKAAAAIKPPFARTFTAFGAAEGENP